MTIKIKSSDVLALLAKRHDDAVFVPECKDGPTQTANHRRMDAWVMAKSWSNPLVTAYEIKVSRSDFIRDDKYHDYLDYCNELYFVCPHGLIQPNELPDDVGLMCVTKTGGRLITKKKAKRRDVQIPENIFRYILMARAQIVSGGDYIEKPKEYWANWLQNKKIDNEFGLHVSESIRRLVNSEILKVRRENVELQSLINNYEFIKQRIEELGFDPSAPYSKWEVINKLEAWAAILPRDFEHRLERTINDMKKIQTNITGETHDEHS